MSSGLDRRSFLKLLALLPLLGARRSYLGGSNDLTQTEGVPNILILCFGALSARNVSLYGYKRKTMPNLARFAERATVYHTQYAGGNFTTPGVASILTGTYPWSHRALHLTGTVTESYKNRTLFNLFGARAYNRIAYTHNPLTNVLLHQVRDDLNLLKRSRDLYVMDGTIADRLFPKDHNAAFWSEWLFYRGHRSFSPTRGSNLPISLFLPMLHRRQLRASERKLKKQYGNLFPRGVPRFLDRFFLLEHTIDWIQAELSRWPQPFLACFFLGPPHQPYVPRREFVGLFDDGWIPVAKKPHFSTMGRSDELVNNRRRDYDEFIAYADAEFGRLYDFMAQTGVLDSTYVVLTSDHGEMFERGIHGHITKTLYEPVIRVPLVISKPGQRQHEDVYTATSAVDLLPTLLHATGQSIPSWCEGEVLPAFGKEAAGERSVFVVEAKSNPKHAPLTKGTVALIKGRYKLIRYFGYDGHENEYELYDLTNDPEEMEDLYWPGKSDAIELQSELEEKLREVNQPYIKRQ